MSAYTEHPGVTAALIGGFALGNLSGGCTAGSIDELAAHLYAIDQFDSALPLPPRTGLND